MWGQTEVWVTGDGEAIPVEELEPSHLSNIIRRIGGGTAPTRSKEHR